MLKLKLNTRATTTTKKCPKFPEPITSVGGVKIYKIRLPIPMRMGFIAPFRHCTSALNTSSPTEPDRARDAQPEPSNTIFFGLVSRACNAFTQAISIGACWTGFLKRDRAEPRIRCEALNQILLLLIYKMVMTTHTQFPRHANAFAISIERSIDLLNRNA